MNYVIIVFFVLSALTILKSNVLYGLSIDFLYLFYKKKKYKISENYNPTLTLMIVAHNEEHSIKEKLENSIKLKYSQPFNILVTSDNSTDKTNEIVENFIKENKGYNISLYKVKKRGGKTNAQNEAQKQVGTEILVMTDANAMLDCNALIEIIKYFYDDKVSYVCGKLTYVNSFSNTTARNEGVYWKRELQTREKESKIKSITAGNGALYAVRNSKYHDFSALEGHDGDMPRYYVSKGQKALYNPLSIAYEKAGENNKDEFKRKVRMNRMILSDIPTMFKMLNVFKYGIYSYLYIGHRSTKSMLWLSHILLLLTNIYLAFYYKLFLWALIVHLTFYLFAIIGTKVKFILFSLPHYYTLTIAAQLVAVKRGIFRQNKAFWEKAESTR